MSVIIYVLTNTINNKQYVGKSKETAQKRFRQHVRESRKGSECAIHRAIRKYGSEMFLVETVDAATTKAELSDKEREWIAKLGTQGKGYNMMPGGEGHGHAHSEETKVKIRAKQIERFKDPLERVKAAGYGRLAVLSDKGMERKRAIMKGNSHAVGMTYTHTDAAKEAIGRAHTGKIVSDETKSKLSEARRREAPSTRNALGQFSGRPTPEIPKN